MAQSGVGGICTGSAVQQSVLSTGSSTTNQPSSAATAGVAGAVAAPQQQPTSTTGSTVPVGSMNVQSQSQFQNTSNNQFTRLRVEDALSYLDQVKIKFSNHPQVYNDFLDIMKEFKSQTIDTPGVIGRVSALFEGHPELIVGFNTFLPPGYKIERDSNNQVQVSMPSTTYILPNTSSSSTLSNVVAAVAAAGATGGATVGPILHHSSSSGATLVANRSAHTHPLVVANSNSSSTRSNTSSTTSTGNMISGGGHSSIVATTGSAIQSSVTSNVSAATPTTVHLTSQHQPQPPQQQQHLQQQTLISGVGGATISSALKPATLSNANSITNISLSCAKAPQAQGQQMNPQDSPVTSHAATNGGTQPVEFNHAINYVNKIKLRFQSQPEVYKQFLDILHAYQKEHKNVKENKNSDRNCLTESEVYAQVARLFQNDEDLLQEFGQFLPDANSTTAAANFSSLGHTVSGYPGHGLSSAISQHVDNLAAAHRAANNDHGAIVKKPLSRPGLLNQSSLQLKRLGSQPPYGMNKRLKMTSLRDVTLCDALKVGSLNEFSFFDKVRKALRNTEVYENFLRCLVIYNHEIISRTDLMYLVNPFLVRYPELLKWLKDFLHQKDSNTFHSSFNSGHANNLLDFSSSGNRGTSGAIRERMSSETGMEIDYAACKRYGASYRALPKNYPQPTCSGRSALCKEVLNDTWVSFPSWSEDSTFVTSKKTQYEEYISKCEDERYELDVVIETNLSTIRVLEVVQKKLNRMSPEERNRFRLDDTLGGTSTTIHQRAIRRIYGDKANEIVDGMKKNPVVAVPIVLRRLKSKEEEWREAQKSFNKIWREQNERYYLKSLDHQGISFKQNDIRYLRSKSLIHEIENLFEERHEQNEEAASGGDASSHVSSGPHITLHYQDKSMIEEACNLIIHHIKRQTSIHKQDKQKIKQLMRHFIPDLFNTPRGDLSDDELDECDFDRENVTSRLNSSAGENSRSHSETVNGTNNSNNNNNNSNTNNNNNDSRSSSATSAITTTPAAAATSTTVTNSSSNANGNSAGNCSQADSSTDANNVTFNRNGHCASNASTSSVSRSESPKNPNHQSHNHQSQTSHDEYTLFFGNNNWYLFFRLHNILCQRLATMYQRAQIIASEEAKEKCARKDSIALRLKPKSKLSPFNMLASSPLPPTPTLAHYSLCPPSTGEIEVEEYFPGFVDMVKQVLDGNLDSNQFEDMLREMFGIHAYIGFTMDKVVQNICRQLQHIVCDESCSQCTHLFIEELRNGGLSTGGSVESQANRLNYENAYQKKAENLLLEENCYKIVFYKGEGKVTIELLDTDQDENENKHDNERWSGFIEKYAREDDSITDEVKERLCKVPIFLTRNIPPWRRKVASDVNIDCDSSSNEQVNASPAHPTATGSTSTTAASSSSCPSTSTSQSSVNAPSLSSSDGTCKAGGDLVASNEATKNSQQANLNNKSIDQAKMKQTSSCKDSTNKTSDDEQLKDLQINDNTQCRFNVNSYKMLYFVEGNDWMHRRSALSKARSVSTHSLFIITVY